MTTTILNLSSFAGVSTHFEEIGRLLARDNHLILRGLVTEEEILEARRRLAATFDRSRDLRATPDAAFPMPNYQRLDVGSYGPGSNIRLRRSFALYPWNDDVTGLAAVFREMGRLRNRLMGIPAGLFDAPAADDDFFETPQVAQYPLGGGFISPHVDRLRPEITSRLPGYRETHVVALIMSQRAFHTGGG